jgi:hypothetical protein
MAAITDARLSVAIDVSRDKAALVVTCDVAFTEVEVNAMNVLGLQYTLQCRVHHKNRLEDDLVLQYRDLTFPRVAGEARPNERAEFDETVPQDNLHERYFGTYTLSAELRLRNGETGAEVSEWTEAVRIDRAA